MEKIERLLDIQRNAFEVIFQDIDGDLKLPNPDVTAIKGKITVLDVRIKDINSLSEQLIDLLLDQSNDQDAIIVEISQSNKLNIKYNTLKMRIEFKKFGGDLKDWISFWSQFKRIHENENIEKEDKFQYLIQATIVKSRARQLIESYPPSAENYEKVINNLKARFGKDELLIEFYVRELLKLVLTNLKNKSKLTFLYDNLESQLQSLETLGVTSEKYAAMLFPMVESCLPEDLLKIWQRSQNNYDLELTQHNPENVDSRLKKLMEFLKKEVEGEQKISLATTSFDFNSKKNEIRIDNSMPTASGLINHQKIVKCVFCKNNHLNEECTVAKSMNLNEKKKILSSCGYCHLCLKYGHIARKCRVKLQCQYCKERHVTLMCPKLSVGEEGSRNRETTTVESLSNNTFHHVFLQTLVVELKSPTTSRKVRVIIDTGSQRSYINKFVASEMEFTPLGSETLVHGLFGGESEVINHTVYKIRLDNLDKSYACDFQVLDQPIICTNVTSIHNGQWLQEMEDLGVKVGDTSGGPIDVLIGADVAGRLFTGKKYLLACGLVAMETLLGWTLLGKVANSCFNLSTTSTWITSLFCKNDRISNLWSLEIIGIADPIEQKTKKEAQVSVFQHFYDTVIINDEGRYDVSLPWIEGHSPMSSNFKLVKRRLDNLMLKLSNDGYYDEYNKVFSEWLSEGVIEVVPKEEQYVENAHYLPHRHVVNLASTTTKLRPVFNASAKEKGFPSLNQCLEKGINLLELIPELLIRFRLFRIGVIADIRRAFLQISILKEDRDVLRFLWYDEDGHLLYFRHARVVFGITCSPFHLNAVIQCHLKNILNSCKENISHYSQFVLEKLMKCFYVDNCVTSVGSEEELRVFIDQATQIMAEAKFDLRLWEHTILNNNLSEPFVSHLLGLKWNRLDDTLELCLDWLQTVDILHVNKRNILSFVNKIFDPIGFSCPVLLPIKILLQNLWCLKIGWDEEVSFEIRETFLDWVKELRFLINLKIPRHLVHLIPQEIKIKSKSLHLFSDASQYSYAAVVFLRVENMEGFSTVQLVQAKSRLSPIGKRKSTIPRLELLAATIGSRLVSSVLSTLGSEIAVYCWSDSSTVLAWIHREENWKPFVSNRITEIRSLIKKENWRYIPGHLNPADLPSRGCSAKRLLQSKWWEGPSWLAQDRQFWPIQEYEADEIMVTEEKRKGTLTSCINVPIDYTWYYRYFSKIQQILNLIGWIKRFVNNCRQRQRQLDKSLTLNELDDAEKTVIKLIQQESFTGLDDKSLISLSPFLDKDSLIRLKTKIVQRDDSFDFRHPILLPSNHPVVFRLIFKWHVDNYHIGVQGLLNQLREKFWIIKGRRTIKSVISKCVTCRRYESKNFDSVPIELPQNRVKDVAVFEIVGIDLAGPLFVKSMEKVWICIFTCAVYRAVHLELVSNLSTDSFIQAFRKFISRRGRPAIIYSDNGTNFMGTEHAFNRVDWTKINEYSTTERITWKFSPPSGAWWGGWWERLIRTLKQLLRKTLGVTSLSHDELSVTICECEALMNSRPLTYVSEDAGDLIPLTPSMFLQEVKEIGVPDMEKIDAESLNKHMKYRNKLRMDLKKRFRKKYLGQLIMRNRKHSAADIKVGDVVLVGNECVKRMNWPLALVTEMFPGKDGNVRVVKLKTASGVLTRPVRKLYPLEVNSGGEMTNLRESLKGRGEVEETGEQEVKEEEVRSNRRSSRYGRILKKPDRFQPTY